MNIIKDMGNLSDEDVSDTAQALMAELDHRRAVAALHRQVEDDIRAYQMVAGIINAREKRPDGTWPEWVQPSGVQDAYLEGSHVSHNGTVWLSSTPANMWEPGVSGWRAEATPDEHGDVRPADWVQPTGAHDAYGKGDRVTFNGAEWESTIDGNVWPPDVKPDGWKRVES